MEKVESSLGLLLKLNFINKKFFFIFNSFKI